MLPIASVVLGWRFAKEVRGRIDGQQASYCSTLVHDNAAIASGCGTGSIAQLLLDGKLKKPGVSPVEDALPTDLFEQAMHCRNIKIHHGWGV